jgi:hypothetical protein
VAKKRTFFFERDFTCGPKPFFFWGVQMEFSIQNEINSFHLFCNTNPVFSPEQCAAADAVVQQALENIKRKQEAQVQPPVFVPVFEYEVPQDDLPMIDDWSSVMGSIGH